MTDDKQNLTDPVKKENIVRPGDDRQINENEKYTFSYAFKQQQLRAWQPVPTLACAIVVYLIFGALFLGIGIFLYNEAEGLHETRIRYDETCGTDATCSISFTLSEVVVQPIFVYYEINNFYQNHRRYFKSKSPEQMRDGEIKTASAVSDCDPVKYNKDITFTTTSIDGTTQDTEGVAFPCGAMARSYFNDSFVITYTQGNANTVTTVSHTGIAWPDDVANKYKNIQDTTSKNSLQWLDVEDERFMVWMRAAATPNFRKIWGKIETDLAAGTYTIAITNNWPVSTFSGRKYFLQAKTNHLGGKNYFLATVYMVMGSLCLVFTLAFIIRKVLRPKGILEAKLK